MVEAARGFLFALTFALLLAFAGCSTGGQAQDESTSATDQSGSSSSGTAGGGGPTTNASAGAGEGSTQELPEEAQAPTPIVGKVLDAPIPFAGSDGRTHPVYELEVTNFSSGKAIVEKLQVLNPDNGDVVATLDAEEVASRLQPAGLRETVDSLAPSMTAIMMAEATPLARRMANAMAASRRTAFLITVLL
jgi:hypothetical protein